MEDSNLVPFIQKNLDILFVGLNPARGSSLNRHYFSVNQAFWNQLFQSGLITAPVNKYNADDIVFGTRDINYNHWSYGITDLITEIAESDSTKIKPTRNDCTRLKETIINYKPKTAILLHGTVVKSFLTYLGKTVPPTNCGYIGRLLTGCEAVLYSIAFPHGNTIRSEEKIARYIELKEYLERVKSTN